MGANGSIGVPTGGAAPTATFVKTTGSVHQQLFRGVIVETETESAWAASTTGSAVIGSDINRVRALLMNRTTVRIYMRFDATVPLSNGSNAHWFLEPDERWQVPDDIAPLPFAFVAAQAGTGNVMFWAGSNS